MAFAANEGFGRGSGRNFVGYPGEIAPGQLFGFGGVLSMLGVAISFALAALAVLPGSGEASLRQLNPDAFLNSASTL
ncbi:MAG: hypothetical protein U0931_13425 [Vulcanimicrobiota bacterium]